MSSLSGDQFRQFILIIFSMTPWLPNLGIASEHSPGKMVQFHNLSYSDEVDFRLQSRQDSYRLKRNAKKISSARNELYRIKYHEKDRLMRSILQERSMYKIRSTFDMPIGDWKSLILFHYKLHWVQVLVCAHISLTEYIIYIPFLFQQTIEKWNPDTHTGGEKNKL